MHNVWLCSIFKQLYVTVTVDTSGILCFSHPEASYNHEEGRIGSVSTGAFAQYIPGETAMNDCKYKI